MPLNSKIIAVDARPLCYGFTGNSRYLFESLKYMVRKDSPYKYLLLANKEVHSIFQNFIEANSSILNVKIKKMTGILWLNFWLPTYLKEAKADLFWGTLQLLPYQKCNIPEIVNYHDLNFVSAPQTMDKMNYWQHKLLSKRTMLNADRILCLSKNTQIEIEKYYPLVKDKLSVIYPGVEYKLKSMVDVSKYGSFFLTVGTLEPRKNISTIINAYLAFKEYKPASKLKLVIAGRSGWGESELNTKLISGELEHKGIYFVQNPDENLLANLYNSCHTFLFPSLHEGFGLPILEALIYGKVCAVSDIPVFREIVDPEVDFLIPPLDKTAWENLFLSLARSQNNDRKKQWDPKLWKWEKTAQQIEKEIDKVFNHVI